MLLQGISPCNDKTVRGKDHLFINWTRVIYGTLHSQFHVMYKRFTAMHDNICNSTHRTILLTTKKQ